VKVSYKLLLLTGFSIGKLLAEEEAQPEPAIEVDRKRERIDWFCKKKKK